MSNITPEFERITPSKAEKYMEAHVESGFGQRTLSPIHVDMLVRAITNGHWEKSNGETIKIAENGAILDGRHRLTAIIRSGKPVTVLVVHGVNPAAFSTIDTGRPRTMADLTRIKGLAHGALLASAATLATSYSNRTSNLLTPVTRMKHPKDEVLVKAATDNLLQGICVKTGAMFKRIFPVPSSIAFAYWVAAKHNRGEADAFFERVSSGENLGVSDPAFTLREKLIQMKASRGSVNRDDVIYYILRAFRAHLRGEKLKTLALSRGALEFPKLRAARTN